MWLYYAIHINTHVYTYQRMHMHMQSTHLNRVICLLPSWFSRPLYWLPLEWMVVCSMAIHLGHSVYVCMYVCVYVVCVCVCVCVCLCVCVCVSLRTTGTLYSSWYFRSYSTSGRNEGQQGGCGQGVCEVESWLHVTLCGGMWGVTVCWPAPHAGNCGHQQGPWCSHLPRYTAHACTRTHTHTHTHTAI